MRVAIAFDSARGTTESAAIEIGRRLSAAGHECSVRSIAEADPAEVAAADLICVGSWTRGLFVVGQHPTPAALSFIDELGDLHGKRAVAFCTYKLATGPTLKKMASSLRARGADVVAEFEFRGPEPTHAFSSFARLLGAGETDEAKRSNGSGAPKDRAPRFLAERAETVFARARRTFMRTTDLVSVQTPERSSSLYGLWARVYEPSVHLDPAYQRGLDRMIELTVRRGDRVLDVGCGTGLGTFTAAERAREVVAIDPSASMIGRLEARLRRRRIDSIRTVLGPFPDALERGAPFDCVISSFMMAHVPPYERRAMYESMYQQLGEGGRLGLFTARGEIARRFATIDQTLGHLEAVGFVSVCVRELDDVYRIVTAERPA